MKKLSTNEIRAMWLEFFKNHDHYIESSKSLIPVNDNSLLFINSGVATLKKYFDGSEQPPCKRITNAQKSLRTNDIENVGVTSRHHTLFEMLGNFSIGDYFKKEAIEMMYELMFSPQWFAFDINDFYFTIHPDDHESYQLLLDKNIKPQRIVKLEENFWEIGAGPGGPNLEIFYDRGESFDTRDPYMLLAQDLENDRVIEVWNIVFSQYNCQPDTLPRNQYLELPQKNIDTGMGLERMASIMQHVETNFETDNFIAIIHELEKLSNHKYEEDKMPFRVIADHIRALTFAIADGVIPSNEKRGYVIRRILRRASKYGYQNLGLKTPFLYQLVDIVVAVSQPFYDYLLNEKDYVKTIIKDEEERFLKTLASGIELLKAEMMHLDNKEIPGALAFKLYDTYGFPIELTQEIAQEDGYSIDLTAFNHLLDAQKQRGKDSFKDKVAMKMQNEYLQNIDIASEFVGYDTLALDAKIVLMTDLHQDIDYIDQGNIYLILDKCPFYAESGGQVSDRGFINGNEVISVTKLKNKQHLIEVCVNNPLKINEIVYCEVDKQYRDAVCKHHSATHLLHYALQQTLGKNAKQAGSYQDNSKTRFDFSHQKPLTIKQIETIETLVNDMINKAYDVKITSMPLKEAQALGAMSLFGEKYGDIVRVVSMGDSIELCGGTHVLNTKDINKFHIISEVGIGSGIRRIEAVCDQSLTNYLQQLINQFHEEINNIETKINDNKLVKNTHLETIYHKINHIFSLTNQKDPTIDEQYRLICEKIIKNDEDKKANAQHLVAQLSAELQNNIKQTAQYQYLDATINDVDIKQARNIMDNIINEKQLDICILRIKNGNIINIIIKSTNDNIKANELLKTIITPLNGKGGGNPVKAEGSYTI